MPLNREKTDRGYSAPVAWRCYDAAIIILGSAVYFKALFFGLTYLDDNLWVLDYQPFLKNLSNIFRIFAQPDPLGNFFYRPLVYLSFALNAQFGGVSPFGYHFLNILIHIVNACLVRRLFRTLEYPSGLALSGALIFTVHPALTQAVVWIPGRTDSLLSLFILLSFGNFPRFLKTKKKIYLFRHILFFVFSLLTKETAVVLPVICFLYAYLMMGRKEELFEQKRPCFFSWLLIIGLWLMIRKIVLSHAGALTVITAAQSLFENLPALISYFGKVYFPVNLSVVPFLKDLSLTYGGIVLVGGAILLLLSKHKRMSHIYFGACWFLLFLLPSLVLSFLKHEYRLYLPIVGCLILLFETDILKAIIKQRRAAVILTLGVISLFSMITFQYSNKFKDGLTFWESAVETSPHLPLAHRNLGAIYHLQKHRDKAQREYRKALELNSKEPMAHNNLGIIYKEDRQLELAEQFFKKEIAVNPDFAEAYFNLGLVYFEKEKYEEAAALWQKTVELDPRFVKAYKQLAAYYLKKNDLKQFNYYTNELKTKIGGSALF